MGWGRGTPVQYTYFPNVFLLNFHAPALLHVTAGGTIHFIQLIHLMAKVSQKNKDASNWRSKSGIEVYSRPISLLLCH
jgi:hypothetical protein